MEIIELIVVIICAGVIYLVYRLFKQLSVKRKKTKEEIKCITDDFFGKISFIKDSGDKNHWFGIKAFGNETVEVLIYGNESGVDEYQKMTFMEFEKRYSEMKPHIEAFINKTLEEKKIEKRTYSIKEDFTISHISIFQSDNNELEIAYELNNDFCWFEVHVADFMPVGLGISA